MPLDRRSTLGSVLAALSASALAAEAPRLGAADAAAAVRDRELAFARTMADRRFAAFADFVSREAVFLGGGQPLVGRDAIAAHWQRFYEGPDAPFSWQPDDVVALASGTLAHSTGPVADPKGRVSSRFYTIWRLEPDGQWRVVFDNGYRTCEAKHTARFDGQDSPWRGRPQRS